MTASKVVELGPSITYLAGYGNYTHIHFEDNRRELYATTLSVFARELPGFVRIHKSYLVNPAYVETYRFREVKLFDVLVGGEWLPVGRRRQDELEIILKRVEATAKRSFVEASPYT